MNVQTLDSVSTAAVTELALVQLRSMPDLDAAAFLDARLRCLEADYKRTFVERGVILIEVQERSLWRLLGDYHSFEQYIVTAAPHSRSDCFAAMKACRELRDIPREQLAEIPRCNIEVLQSLSPSVRSVVIEAAKDLSESKFRKKMLAEYPDQHIQNRRRLVFNLDLSDYDMVCDVLDGIGTLTGKTSREEQFKILCLDFREDRK